MNRTLRDGTSSRRTTALGAGGLVLALVFGGTISSTAAHAAPPVSGDYQGTSTLQYAGDNEVDWEDVRPISFEVDDQGYLEGLTGEYFWTCISGGEPGTTANFGDAPMPPSLVEVGEPFSVNWSSDGEAVDYTFQGVINLDGTAEGLVMANLGVCGASILSWTAETDVPTDPNPVFEIEPIAPVSVWDIARGGITVNSSGFDQNEEVTVTINGESQTTEADFFGELSFAYSSPLAAGSYDVTLSTDTGSLSESFDVIEDADFFDEHTDTPLMFATPEVWTDADTTAVDVFARYLVAGTSIDVRLNGTVVDTIATGDYDSLSFTLNEALPVGQHTLELFHPAVSVSKTLEVVPSTDGTPAPAGDYVGVATQDVAGTTWTSETNTFPLSFTVDAEGNITNFATEYRWVCWLVPDNPTGIIDLNDMPGTRITSDRAFGIGWEASNLDDIFVHGTVRSDGSASGTIFIDTGSCGLAYLEWSADGDIDLDPVYDPEVTASPESLTESALADTGVTISGTGFAPESTVTLSVGGETVTATDTDGDGNVSFTFISDSLGVGTHDVALTTGDLAVETSFTVAPDVVEVTAEAPSRDGNTVTIPTIEGVIYVDGTGSDLTGTVILTEDQTLTVIATADDGYVLTDGTHEWAFEYEGTEPEPNPEPEPETIPGTTPSEDDLDPALEGAITAPSSAQPGDTISIAIDGVQAGDSVGVWLFSTPVYLGTQVVDADGTVTVTIPAATAAGDHKIAVWNAAGEALIGWDSIGITVSEGDAGGEGSGQNGDLATTGSTSAGIAGLAVLGLLVAGAGVLLMRRRATA